jgi:hypothetical protein
MSPKGPQSPTAAGPRPTATGQPSAAVASPDADEAAIARYRYLLRTAPPDELERAHAEAFAQLTPAQRAEVLQGLSQVVPASERATSDDPQALARMATRAEIREPGTMERAFAGPGVGSMMMSTLAGAFIGTAIAQTMFGGMYPDAAVAADSAPSAGTEGAVDPGAASYDGATEGGMGDPGSVAGGDWDAGGSVGGDFGGGDFGGGDFGDFGGF